MKNWNLNQTALKSLTGFPVWTASGDEYYTTLDEDPLSVYYNGDKLYRGTVGTLYLSEWDWNGALYIRLPDDSNPNDAVADLVQCPKYNDIIITPYGKTVTTISMLISNYDNEKL